MIPLQNHHFQWAQWARNLGLVKNWLYLYLLLRQYFEVDGGSEQSQSKTVLSSCWFCRFVSTEQAIPGSMEPWVWDSPSDDQQSLVLAGKI